MAEAIDPILIEVNGTPVRLSQIVKSMRATGKDDLHDLFAQRCLVFQIAQRENIAISRDELQNRMDQWRYKNRLESVEDTERWLSQRRIAFADIHAYFGSRKLAFERREICWILVEEMDIAEEIATQARDGSRDFHALARQYSRDENTRPASGYLGCLTRRDLPPDIASSLFAAAVGEVIGPIKISSHSEREEKGYALYYVQRHCPAVLDAPTKVRCVRELYQLRLRREAKRSHISHPFLNSICAAHPLPHENVTE